MRQHAGDTSIRIGRMIQMKLVGVQNKWNIQGSEGIRRRFHDSNMLGSQSETKARCSN